LVFKWDFFSFTVCSFHSLTPTFYLCLVPHHSYHLFTSYWAMLRFHFLIRDFYCNILYIKNYDLKFSLCFRKIASIISFAFACLHDRSTMPWIKNIYVHYLSVVYFFSLLPFSSLSISLNLSV
jgi:hypothetical protein